MTVHYDEKQQTFHLQTNRTSYVIEIAKDGYLTHRYWGERLRRYAGAIPLRYMDRAFSPNPVPADRTFSLDTLPQEYPAYGNTDFRTPAYQIQLDNGSTVTDLRYRGHRIVAGKPKLAGLPATYVENDEEADTLEIELYDELLGLTVTLSYTVFNELDAITRSVRLENRGNRELKLLRAASISVDFADDGYDMVHLAGGWANERNVLRRPLTMGLQAVDSKRGSSSHQHNPFMALVRKGADEDQGEVYGFSLVYSGNFLANVEVDQYRATRVTMGLNPFDFSWLLQPGESFQTPEAVTVYSNEGLGGMSRTYHRLYRTRLARGEFRDKERPVLINNWEATYFDFNADKIESIARKGKELGIELFVLDDGWFGKRDDDNSSLGDWFVHREKLPGGLRDLAERVTGMDMRFGLWVEPEMISVDSDLYRKHPDWCLHVPDRRRSAGRNQLILDYSRDDVCDAIIGMLSEVLSSAPVTYVKWDMNRNMTEIGSALLPPERQRETAHRYMLGLYRVMETLVTAFPHILFESCSGGGGRFDPGILHYMPQTWTSDNTDAVSRLKIQYGTSIVYPASAIGAHVSAVPNHQVHRTTPLEMRGHVAFAGNFGYELDLTAFTEEEDAIVRAQVEYYKEVRPLVQFGDFYRLLSPFEGNETAWMFVSEDRSEAFAAYYKVLAEPNAGYRSIRLKGLDPDADYRIDGLDSPVGGDELMRAGLAVPQELLFGDFRSKVWRIRKV
ncbi:alpha-galactosidase [uncultured Paenibacillus sp.]|uniref:alpha-galactosidase n=1 Tax=uncultured Paenibacillus sp. TaxID=227322 RepID=UPI0028D55BA9|nr:alpha-galactosidase [uncultured Paenibacillus sp.]